MAGVIAFVDDLFFQAKLSETARQTGIGLRICTTPEALAAAIGEEAPALIVVDLNARTYPIEALERVRASRPDIPLVAYLSHVQADLAARARAAGCTEVMPRSQFVRELATILTQAKSASS